MSDILNPHIATSLEQNINLRWRWNMAKDCKSKRKVHLDTICWTSNKHKHSLSVKTVAEL